VQASAWLASLPCTMGTRSRTEKGIKLRLEGSGRMELGP